MHCAGTDQESHITKYSRIRRSETNWQVRLTTLQIKQTGDIFHRPETKTVKKIVDPPHNGAEKMVQVHLDRFTSHGMVSDSSVDLAQRPSVCVGVATTSQKRAAIPRRVRIEGSQTLCITQL